MPKSKKSDRIWKLLLASIIASIIVLVGMWVYEWWLARRANNIRYAAFGIEIPGNYSIHGIDVSKYQHIIDWESVKSMNVNDVRIRFAFIKATEGNMNVDRYFKRNWRRTKNASLTRGAYHFFLATKEGKTQAENFISSVELEQGDLPPVLDIEQAYGVAPEKLRKRAKEWLETVEDFYKVTPIIYTNVEFYNQYLDEEFDGYPLWVAHYLQKEKPRIYRDWHFWQHSELGRVNGIVSKVDFNVFNGDSLEFSKVLIKN